MGTAKLIGVGLLCIVVAGCGSVTDGEKNTERRPGWIRFNDQPILFQFPETVAVGVPFEVMVRTFGSECVEQGDTEISIIGKLAEVRPYDVFAIQLRPQEACARDLRNYLHHASIRFDSTGLARVRVRGRAHPGDHVVTAERTTVVR